MVMVGIGAGLPLAGQVPRWLGLCRHLPGRLLRPLPHLAAALAGLRRLLSLHQVRSSSYPSLHAQIMEN